MRAVHGRQETRPDPDFEIGLSESLKSVIRIRRAGRTLPRFAIGDGPLDILMRRCIWRAAARRCGHGLQVGSGVGFKHLETFEMGDGVFIGAQAYIQGRFDGTTIIGDHVWIGPQAYMDARDLVIEDYVGWGPGAKVLGSAHTGLPADVPIVQTDLEIKPVRSGVGRHRHKRDDPPRGDHRAGRHRRSRRGRDARRAAVRHRRRRAGEVHAVERRRAGGAAERGRERTMNVKCATNNAADSSREAGARRAGGRGGSPRDPVGLGDTRAGGSGLRARVRRVRRRAPRVCGIELHDGPSSRAAGRRRGRRVMKSSPSATRSSRRRTPSGTAARLPVFVDIEAGTYNMDPALIEPAITERTKAILCVHQLGMPCDLARIVEIGRRRGIPVIEDAACASGSEILWNGRWEKIGKPHGDIACFSFHPRKVITTGDGGMITTANPELDRKFRLWRQHSMSVPDTVRHGAREVIFESYPEVGFNFRMTDMQAAVGRVQLTRLPSIVEERRRIAHGVRLASVRDRRCRAFPPSPHGRARTGKATAWSSPSVRPARRDAADARRRGVDAARCHERAPRARLSDRN